MYKVTFFNNPNNVLVFNSLLDLVTEVERILFPITKHAVILNGEIYIDDDLKMIVGKYTAPYNNIHKLSIVNEYTANRFIYDADMIINAYTGKCVKQRQINCGNYTFVLATGRHFCNVMFKYYFKYVNDELDVIAFNEADVVFELVNDTIYIIKDVPGIFKEYKVVAKCA